MSLVPMESPVTIYNRTGQGGDGRPTFGAGTATRARVLDVNGVFKNRDGQDVTFDRQMWLKETETISVRDKIAYDGADHEVVFLREGRDISNVLDHYKVMVVRLA